MIFYLLYYLLLILSLVATPFVTSQYILAGDPYLLVNSGPYFHFVLAGVTFLLTYAFNMTRYLHYCFISRWDEMNGITDFFGSINGVLIASFYTSLYMTIGALVVYTLGLNVLEGVPGVKDLLLSVIHIPNFELILKGTPLAVGGLAGNILAALCISPQCGGT